MAALYVIVAVVALLAYATVDPSSLLLLLSSTTLYDSVVVAADTAYHAVGAVDALTLIPMAYKMLALTVTMVWPMAADASRMLFDTKTPKKQIQTTENT